MTQEQKELLIKDLSARIPYKVQASYYGSEEECETWDEIEGIESSGHVEIGQYILPIEKIKPYLFPLSSMTEEQSLELEIITDGTIGLDTYSLYDFTGYSEISLSGTLEIIQWCYENHFDINGLIPMELANDATNLNIY